MLMFNGRRPAIRTLRGWAISMLRKPEPSESATCTAGCRTVLIRMPASAPSPSPVKIRRMAFLPSGLLLKFVTRSIRSVTPVQNVHRNVSK
jgi:hypothetical protein